VLAVKPAAATPPPEVFVVEARDVAVPPVFHLGPGGPRGARHHERDDAERQREQ
jgi:hypothetical protein